MSKKSFLLLSIVLICTVLSAWIGWYGTAIAVGIFSIWFGITLWKIARLDTQVLLLLAGQVLLIWLAFALAYLELTDNLSDAFSISMQNLLHFEFITAPISLTSSITYRILAAFEGFAGYLLIVSGVALLIQEKAKPLEPSTQ